MYAEALAELGAVERALPDWPVAIAAAGSVHATSGNRDAARQSLDRLAALSRRRYVTAYGIALVHAALGENDHAITSLQQGVRERTPWMVWLNWTRRGAHWPTTPGSRVWCGTSDCRDPLAARLARCSQR